MSSQATDFASLPSHAPVSAGGEVSPALDSWWKQCAAVAYSDAKMPSNWFHGEQTIKMWVKTLETCPCHARNPSCPFSSFCFNGIMTIKPCAFFLTWDLVPWSAFSNGLPSFKALIHQRMWGKKKERKKPMLWLADCSRTSQHNSVGMNTQQEGYAWGRSVSPGSFIKAPLPGGMDKDKSDFADFVMNLPTSGSWGTKYRTSTCSKSCPDWGEALWAPAAGWAGMPSATLLEAEPKAPAPFSQVAQAKHCWPLGGRVPKPHQSSLSPAEPSLMDVVPHWHPPTQTYQETFPATENSLTGSWLNASCSVGFEKRSNAAGGDLGCYI